MTLLPTPSAANPNDGEDLNEWAARRARIKKSGVNGNGFGMPLGVAVRLMPTPQALDERGGKTQEGRLKGEANGTTEEIRPGEGLRDLRNSDGPAVREARVEWGPYEPAVRRWEAVLGRLAPNPTRPDGKEGQNRLNPEFCSWMMGYPDGWVTDILDRNPAIRACGNGVSPQQAYAAIGQLWSRVINPMECSA